jgi:hypothetical protein
MDARLRANDAPAPHTQAPSQTSATASCREYQPWVERSTRFSPSAFQIVGDFGELGEGGLEVFDDFVQKVRTDQLNASSAKGGDRSMLYVSHV